MAINIQDTVLWIPVNSAYVKIFRFKVIEQQKIEVSDPKKYTVTISPAYYTDNTKEFAYKQEDFDVVDVLESEITLTNLYNKLKTALVDKSPVDC